MAAGLVDISTSRSPARRAADVWQHRALLVNFVRRDLRVRYKGSFLGFVWSLLSPAMYLVVFSIVFKELLRVQIPRFGIFLLTGLLVWNFFSGSLTTAATSLTENRSLVQKVWFPREVLPLSAVGASLVNLGLQSLVLAAGLVVFRHQPDWGLLWLLVPAVVVLVVVATGLSVMVAALNVRYRDVKHLLDVGLTAWFWVSAIVYPYTAVADRLGSNEWITTFNPIVPVVLTFQRVIYHPAGVSGPDQAVLPELDASWYLTRLGVVGLGSLLVLWLSFVVFERREAEFGDQL